MKRNAKTKQAGIIFMISILVFSLFSFGYAAQAADDVWTEYTPGPGQAQFAVIYDIAVDQYGNLYVAGRDAQNQDRSIIRKRTPDGTWSDFLEDLTSSIAVNSKGTVYYATASSPRQIMKLSDQGQVSLGPPNPYDSIIEGIAVDDHDNVYVTVVEDGKYGGIYKYSNDSWTQIYEQEGLKGITVDRSGDLYVTKDTDGDGQIQHLSSNGNFIQNWSPSNNRPSGIDLDQAGNIYVAYHYEHKIYKYTKETEEWMSFGDNGSDPGQFLAPKAIAVDSAGNLYVGSLDNRIQKMGNAPIIRPAPSVTVDDSKNTIIGANDQMEYSTNNGDTWTTYDPADEPTFPGNQIVLIRLKEAYLLAGDFTTLTFTVPPAPDAPNVTADDAMNKIVGANGTMEYSTDNGANWITYNTVTTPTFTGTQTVLVRVMAVGDTPAGEPATLSFTPTPAPAAPNVTADDTANTIVGIHNMMEFSTDGGTTWTAYYTDMPLSFPGTQTVLVRIKAWSDAPAGAATTLHFTAPLAPAAPSVTADDTANTIVGANGTMEYSTDNGATWTTYNTTAEPTFSGAQTVLVRVKAVNDTPAGAVTTLTFTAPAPSTTGGGGGYVPQTNSQNISSANGGVFEQEGAKVEAPAGALSRDFKVMITKVSDPSALPVNEKSQRVGEVYEITKDQTGDFDKSVTITLPYDKNKVDVSTQELGIFWFNETTKQWVRLENIKVDSNAGTVSGEVSHFTKFAILAVEKEVAPTVDPIEQKPVIEFSDTQGHWAEQSIRDLVSLDAINGFPDGTFKPNAPITRAEFSSILVKALGLTCETGKIFSDTEDHWAQACISTAEANGLVTGIGADKFGPDEPITREQMAVIVARAAKLEVTSANTTFGDDNRISAWAKPAVAAAARSQLVTGLPDGTFDPQGKATRAEAATVIIRFIFSAEA